MNALSAIVTIIVALITAWTSLRVSRIEKGVNAVNNTVNPAVDGAPTLVERVTTEAKVNAERWDWTCESVVAIGREVGAHLRQPPTHGAAV